MQPELVNYPKLKCIVEELTTSGRPALDNEKLKCLKSICRSSDSYVIELFDILIKKLGKRHAEIRLSSFQICNEIFLRSHCFRELVSENFKKIAELTVLHDKNDFILKPIHTANKLKVLAIENIHNWYEKFKSGYKFLALGYKYLKECCNVDFENMAILTERERREREEERRKQESIRDKRILKVRNDISEWSINISNIVLEFNNAFKLLIPDLDNFFIPIDECSHNNSNTGKEDNIEDTKLHSFEYGSDVMREHGLTKETTVQVNLSDIHTIEQTCDNEVVISTLNEQIKTIKNKFLPKVKEWEQSIMQYSSTESDVIRNIIDLKHSLESALKQYASITIIIPKAREAKITKPSAKFASDSYSSDEDDDFIDVPFDDRVAEANALEAALLLPENQDINKSKSMVKISLSDFREAGSSGVQNSLNKSNKRLTKKTITDLDIDNFATENNENIPNITRSITGLTNIWSANEVLHDHGDDVLKPSDALGIATRVVDFERSWEPVRWECRAPLPSGRLCPRKDRERCPLHGAVVPRDNLGKPIKSEDARADQQRRDEHERTNPEWQNPILLAEIRATTGVDLDMKKAKKRKKKYPNLADLKAIENTPRKRLQRKVLSKKTFRRINKALAALPP